VETFHLDDTGFIACHHLWQLRFNRSLCSLPNQLIDLAQYFYLISAYGNELIDGSRGFA